FSLEEDLASLEAETILEAEEILGTVQSYIDSSVISIIEDFSSLSESKGFLDADNELSLLTAITEILDSTDDETLSPFDTLPDSELLTSPRERETSSFQRLLSLSRTPPERDIASLDDHWGPSTSTAGKVEAGASSLPWTLASICPEDLATPKKPSSRAERWPGRRRVWELPLVQQRSDGEEEDAPSPQQDSLPGPSELTTASGEDGATLDQCDMPCIINPEKVSLSELVRSMHPYCLTVCLDPESRPVAEELLAGSAVLEIVPDSGESLEIPVVLQHLAPVLPSSLLAGDSASDNTDRAAGLLLSARETEQPMENPQGPSADPLLGAEPRDEGPVKSLSWPQTEASGGEKNEAPEKGRGRTLARKSGRKPSKRTLKGQALPPRDSIARRLRSASTQELAEASPSHPLGQAPSS
uniref:Peroxisome proliferator-activated receptor gamma coactivator-related protein 1 n=1 Tax=Sphenodon punctatus TaxID=8508 RepID=A0A8D0GYA8_SPHPU